MYRKTILRLVVTGTACAVLLFAADFWKTKEYTQWTAEEVNKLLTSSPWAKEETIGSPQDSEGGRRGGRGGGIGFPGGGVGFPGGSGRGGGGYPGGGYPGGGAGYPGGRGSGYPNDGSGRDDGSGRATSMNVIVRWESALPIRHALLRQGGAAADEKEGADDKSEKYYIVGVLGFRMPGQRNRSLDDDDNPPEDRNDRRSNQSNDALRSQFLDAAQLAPKGKPSIFPEDVQFEGPNGSGAIRFLFPRKTGIFVGDKEVDFILDVRRIRLEQKFRLNEMQYQGKLAL
jgi:hypothetical protein